MTINEMLERSGWTQKRFSDYFGIPYRTVQHWTAGSRECPDYVRSLIQYKFFKEGIIMNMKITYRFAQNYDLSQPNNGFSEETDYIITDGVYDFTDYMQDHEVYYEEDEDTEGLYHVLDSLGGERTGAAYMVISTEPTDEDLIG